MMAVEEAADAGGRLSDTRRLLLAHEWIASVGGSENVFRELMCLFPEADALCLWNDVPESFERPVNESVLASSRLRGRKAAALPFMPRAWAKVDLAEYDAVLVSSHAFSHHLAGRAAREGREAFAYVHTPARYIWAPEVEHRGRSLVARLGSVPLRQVDRRAVDQLVHYAANSEYVRQRIQRAWDVGATVIYPPVQVERIRSVPRWVDALPADEARLFETLPKGGFILGASRLVSYKRLDLVMEVGQAIGMPVVIAGAGPDEAMLRDRAAGLSVPVTFTGRVSDEQLYALYQEATLFVFMAIEDFGIMPVEAMAAGAPVLVNEVGGAKESVLALNGGVAVSASAGRRTLADAARACLTVGSPGAATESDRFSVSAFRSNVEGWVRNGGR